MAKNSVDQWDTSAGNNTDIGGISLAEGSTTFASLNNIFREMMAQIASYLSAFLFGDGTAAAPSMSFENDTDTGIYRPASDRMGISLGGTLIYDLRSTDLFVPGTFDIENGANDKIQFKGSNAIGIRSNNNTVLDMGPTYFNAQQTYDQTTAAGATLRSLANGQIVRSTSDINRKEVIDANPSVDWVWDLAKTAFTYKPKTSVEGVIEETVFGHFNEDEFYGFSAQDFAANDEARRLVDFHPETGHPEGLFYDRFIAPFAKATAERFDAIEARLDKLEASLNE